MANLSKYRLGTTVPMAVSLIDSGVSLSWPDVEILQLCVYSEAQKAFAGYCPFEVSGEDATKLLCSFPAKQQAFVGDYRLVAQLKYNDNEATYDALAFTLVGKTEDVEDVSTNPETVEVGITISTLPSSTITEILNACIKATADAKAQTEAASEAEALRVQAEQARVTAENARVTAETARAEAERLRAQAETQRESDCQTAINEMKETINAMSLGLFTVTCEDGDLYLITNGAGSAIKGADITDDNVLEITIDA